MQKLEEIVNKIKRHEQAIEKLRVEYYKYVRPCDNTECPFHTTFWDDHIINLKRRIKMFLQGKKIIRYRFNKEMLIIKGNSCYLFYETPSENAFRRR